MKIAASADADDLVTRLMRRAGRVEEERLALAGDEEPRDNHGRWMAMESGDLIRIENEPIVIGSELGEGGRQELREKAKEVAKSFYAAPVTNISTAHQIHIRSSSIRHSISGEREKSEIHAVAKLPEMVSKATYIGAFPDKRQSPDVVAVHRYAANIQDDKGVRQTMIVVKENKDGKRLYDHHYMKKPAGTSEDE